MEKARDYVTLIIPQMIVRVPIERVVGGPPAGLTAVEKRVWTELVQGKSNKEIANAIGSSARTAKFHVSSIYRKTGVSGRSELLRRFGKT